MGEGPLTAHDIRASAEVHAELGPEYGDAVVESFLAKIDKQIEAKVEERLASLPLPRRRRPVDPVRLSKWRYALAGGAVGALVTGIPLTVVAGAALAGTGASGRVLLLWVVPVIIVALTAYLLRRRR